MDLVFLREPGYHLNLHTKIAIWFGWLAFISLITGRYLHWEIEYFRSPGPVFYKAVLLLLPLFLLACGAYLQIRGNRVRRLEAPALALLCVASLAAYQPLAMLIGALLLLSSVSTGLRIARLLGIPLKAAAEVLALGFGFGCTALMLVLFALGLAHALVPWLLLTILLLPIALFPREAIQGARAVARAIQGPAGWPGFESPIAGVAVICMAITAACAVALTVTPSVAFDPLATHLVSAKYYAARHALEPVPSLDYSYFPQGCEILMALGYGLGGQAAAQIVSPLFWVLLLVLVFAIARECGLNQVAALAGTVCAAAMPFAHWAGNNAKNDAPMSFFQAASLYAFLRWLKTREPGWIAAGAAFLGATFAIKHTALFGAVPLAGFCGYALLRSRARVRTAVLCGALFIASGFYWDIRTFVLKGNPVYPAAAAQSVNVGIVNPGKSVSERLARYAEVVWQVQFQGQTVFESPLPNPAGVALIVFLPMAFLVRRRPSTLTARFDAFRQPLPNGRGSEQSHDRKGVVTRNGTQSRGQRTSHARRACLVFSLVYLAYWLATVAALRYALLPLGLVTVLLIGKAITFYDQIDIRAARASVACALAGTLLFSVLGIAIIEVNGPMLMLLAKRIDAPAYLRSVLPAYGALEWLNRNRIHGNILATESFSRAYAPDPGKYYVVSLSDPNLPRNIEAYACDFVIMREDTPAARGQESLFGSLEATPAYCDAYLAVYRVKRRL